MRKFYFEKLLDKTVSQIRYSSSGKDDYIIVLFCISLIVNQAYPRFKGIFEEKLINEIDDIVVILKIITNEQYNISSKGINKIQKRLEQEIFFINNKYIQRKQMNEVREIEHMVKMLKPNNLRVI